MMDPRKTSVMIIEVTRPLDRPFSLVSKCSDEALRGVKDYFDKQLLQNIPFDGISYWC